MGSHIITGQILNLERRKETLIGMIQHYTGTHFRMEKKANMANDPNSNLS